MFPYDQKIDKWERLGYSIEREGYNSIVDGTQNFDRTTALIEQLSVPSLYLKAISYEAVKSQIHRITDHKIGNRVI